MAIMLSVYTEHAFREIRLPMLNNSDFTIMLYKNIYGLNKDIALKLEIINDEWEFVEGTDYSVFKGNDNYERCHLQDKDVLKIYTDSEMLTVVVKRMEQAFYSFCKFSVSRLTQIRIGKN